MNTNFLKSLIRTGDAVALIRGEARHLTAAEVDGKPVSATVDRIDRRNGKVYLHLETEREADSMGRQKPVRGIEIYKNVRFNPQNNEPGGQKVVARPVHLSNVQLRCPGCGRVGRMNPVREPGTMEEGKQRNGRKQSGVIIKRKCVGSKKKPGCGHVF